MHRFFVSPSALSGEQLTLTAEQARQIYGVLRLKPGEQIGVFDNSGREYRIELTEVGREQVVGRVAQELVESREPKTEIVLYQALLKADKFEWVLQKGTELGVSAFAPLLTERVVSNDVSHAKRQRWERIIVEAAEQSGRTTVPRLLEAIPLAQALETRPEEVCALIPWEEERETDLRRALASSGPVHLFIGPEGGLTVLEVKLAREKGVRPVTMGPRILRAETAALAAVSAVLFARGDMDAWSDRM